MYKCCRTVLQSNWKHCPHCGDLNPHFEGIKKRRYYPYEGRMLDNNRRVAVKTTEFRTPRKGEYFLSGAHPIACKAPNNLTTAYRIMRLIDKPVELPR